MLNGRTALLFIIVVLTNNSWWCWYTNVGNISMYRASLIVATFGSVWIVGWFFKWIVDNYD